jgi:beta-glucosidase
MRELAFPDGFLWGAATAAHQVEGDNTNSDWWEWEHRPDTKCAEPSGSAIEHYHRYTRDTVLLAQLGFNTYRFGVEWARIEPTEGAFDVAALDHYQRMAESVRKARMTPVVTLNHFTLPLWVAKQGGWLSPRTPALFARFARRVVETLGDDVDWYCTVNEPGAVALGGYEGAWSFPPGTHGLANWKAAIAGLIEGHRQARAAVKEARPKASVGLTCAMNEWEANEGGQKVMLYARRMYEDVFLEAAADDDFIGVQTYTRARIDLPRVVGLVAGAGLSVPALERWFGPWAARRQTMVTREPTPGLPRTQMGWEFRPQAVAAAVRRAASLLPGKTIVVTEHGVATANDADRVTFIRRGLVALHAVIEDRIPLRGYIHWSAFDNFEWAHGYSMNFGLIGVDRATQERTIKPSARFLGDIARTNRISVEP